MSVPEEFCENTDIILDMATYSLSVSPVPAAKRRKSNLSLDLSSLPPLVQPSPPSNTLLITNLHDPSIFISTNLTSLRQLISQTSPIHTWAPLKSFRRIIVSFYDTDSAIAIKQALDGQTVMGERVRVYFGEPTPLAEPLHKHLQAPRSDKMFFISPPPSPPHGWQMRDEDPPNKEVHAEDLASALARLHARHDPLSPEDVSLTKPGSDVDADTPQRTRSGSYSIVYQPDADGNSPGLPAIAVEDLTDSSAPISPMDVSVDKKFVHTSRPPLELNSDV